MRLGNFERRCGISLWLAAAALALAAQSPNAIREIADPYTGIHWLLMRDSGHPGGPGRLVPAASMKNAASGNAATNLRPVIRAGDRLIVEGHTSIADLRLEGTALASAVEGATVKVRLKIGGKVVQARATRPGRATLLEEETRQ